MNDFFLNNINSDYNGYQQIIELYHKYKNSTFENIAVHFGHWFSANLCSPIGAIFDLFQRNFVEVNLNFSNHKILEIFQKNKFLSNTNVHDLYHTTIMYHKLKPSDFRFFQAYINEELMKRSELRTLNNNIKKIVSQCIFEIFINAQIHSETEYIFTCGQYYPSKKELTFTITDTGIGFSQLAKEKMGREVSSIKAIEFALISGYTTKINDAGGLGLSELKEYIEKNCGTLQIISHDGFFESSKNKKFTKHFDKPFPGSIINITFNIDEISNN